MTIVPLPYYGNEQSGWSLVPWSDKSTCIIMYINIFLYRRPNQMEGPWQRCFFSSRTMSFSHVSSTYSSWVERGRLLRTCCINQRTCSTRWATVRFAWSSSRARVVTRSISFRHARKSTDPPTYTKISRQIPKYDTVRMGAKSDYTRVRASQVDKHSARN